MKQTDEIVSHDLMKMEIAIGDAETAIGNFKVHLDRASVKLLAPIRLACSSVFEIKASEFLSEMRDLLAAIETHSSSEAGT